MKNILLCLLLFFAANMAFAEKIAMAIGDWPPYTAKKNSGENIVEKLVAEAFKLEGIEVELKYYPWQRVYVDVTKGKSVGSFPWVKNPQREKEVLFSTDSIMNLKEVFVYRKDSTFDWKIHDDLKKFRIGGTVGYNHVKMLQEHGVTVQKATKDEQNLKKVMAGKLDAFPIDFMVGKQLIKELFGDNGAQLTFHEKPLIKNAAHVIFTRSNPNSKTLDAKFSEGMKKLKESGRYDEIMNEL